MVQNWLLKFGSRSKYWLALALMLGTMGTVLFPKTAFAAGETYKWTGETITGTGGLYVTPKFKIANSLRQDIAATPANVVFTQVGGQRVQYKGTQQVTWRLNGTDNGTPRVYEFQCTMPFVIQLPPAPATGGDPVTNTGTVRFDLDNATGTDLNTGQDFSVFCRQELDYGGLTTPASITGTPPASATGQPAAEEDWCDQSAGDFGWMMCWVVDTAASTVGLLDCQILDLLKIDTVAIFNQQGVATTAPANCSVRLFDEGAPDAQSAASSNAYRAAWSAFRNVALAILVILGLIMVASQIMGLDIFDAYTIRKMLPKLIIATIFLTLSWNIMQFLFTASNAAADAVLAIIEFPFRNINAANGANFANATLAWIIPVLLIGAAGAGAVLAVGLLGFGGILALLASLLLAVFSAWVLLVARDVVATALIIASPLAIICSAYEPFEKLFSFWKGILITILISVPALAAVIGISHAGALIALVGDNIVVAMIILLAGYGLLWAVFKQLDKVTGYFGNVMSQATGRAQKALSDYRSDTMKRRRQEAIEGQRNIPFGRTMRRLSLAGQAGKGGFIGRHNRAQLVAAEQALMQRSAAKRLEEEGGRMSGDDDAMALAMQRGMTRDRFIQEYQQRTGRDGRRALADMEASFGAGIGTQAMRVSAAKARWGSVSAYNDFDIDTPEGARNMYRQMMQDAGEMVADGSMSVTDVVTAMKKNTQRADISGHSFPQMMGQVQMSADRLTAVRGGATNVQGRVIDENNNEVPGVVQNTGSSIRRTRAIRDAAGNIIGGNQVVGQGPNLISDSEIDAWMRGALEYAQPHQIVAGRTETVRILGQQMRTRLERSVAAQQQAETAAAANPNDVALQQAVSRAERETKRQLASLAGRYEVMGQISPENARYMAETVMEHDVNLGAAGNMNVQQLVERYRQDPEFQQYRRELYGANMASAQAAMQGQAAAQAVVQGGQVGGVNPPGPPSDRWLKRDITHVGTAKNGTIQLYRFKYLWDDQEFVGVMAQEILTTHPEAVHVGPDGYYRVHYEALGIPFLTFEEWQAAKAAAKR